MERHQQSIISFKNNAPKFGKFISKEEDIKEQLENMEKILANFLNPWHLIRSENNINVFSDTKHVNVDKFDKEKATKILEL